MTCSSRAFRFVVLAAIAIGLGLVPQGARADVLTNLNGPNQTDVSISPPTYTQLATGFQVSGSLPIYFNTLSIRMNRPAGRSYTLALYDSATGTTPGSLLFNLTPTNAAQSGAGVYSFTAPTNTLLNTGETYYLVLSQALAGSGNVAWTGTTDVASGSTETIAVNDLRYGGTPGEEKWQGLSSTSVHLTLSLGTEAIPEPTTCALFGIMGVAGAAAEFRRRRKAKKAADEEMAAA